MHEKFFYKLKVYYEDTDAGGVVYYANYLKYLERARTEFLREKGYEQDALIDELGVVFSVRGVQVDYLKPAKFNDELCVTTTVAELKRASLTFHQTVIRPATNHEIINTAVIKIACLDANSLKVTAIPSMMIEKLT